MYCSKCGTEINDTSEYCSKCGAKVESNQNMTNNTQNEEKIKKILPYILIILSLPTMLILGIVFLSSYAYWPMNGMLMIIAAFLSLIGLYFIHLNKKLYGRILISIGIFIGLILSSLMPICFLFYSLPNIIALILEYHWFK